MGFWTGRRVAVTGCASFIGSHLTEALVREGAIVRGVDDLSSGKIQNLSACIQDISFMQANLFVPGVREWLYDNVEVVFHLAAEHGGRGFVDQQQCACSTNFALDNLVFMDAVKYAVEKIVFASSGCVYPNYLQGNVKEELYLTEDLVPSLTHGGVPGGYDSDGTYGWAKLMSEFTLQAIHREHGISTVSPRYFTVYGPRGKEDHAVMAMIGRAFINQNPYELWGDGSQIRNWTYVDDIVSGTLAAAEHINDGRGINIGTMERTSVFQAAEKICEMFGYNPEFKFLMDKPTGPLNRVADNNLARVLMNWKPATTFSIGVRKTIDWYTSTKSTAEVHTLFDEKALIDGSRR